MNAGRSSHNIHTAVLVQFNAMNKICSCLRESIIWSFLFAGLLLTAFGAQELENSDLPILFNIRGIDSRGVVLEVSNPSEGSVKFKTNLKAVLGSKFLNFPTIAGVQFRDKSGKLIPMMLQSQDGWWHPRMFSSFIDVDESRRLKALEEVVIGGKELEKHSIDLQDMLVMANTTKVDGDVIIADVKFRIKITVSYEGGVEVKVPITSQWIPVAKHDQEEQKR